MAITPTSAAPTRQRFIDAAFELFTRNGFHQVGLDRILAEVGVSKQTFYNHFESRDALILETLEKRGQWELTIFNDMLNAHGADPRTQLEHFFDVLHAWLNRPEFKGCIFLSAAAEFPDPRDPAHKAAAEHNLGMQRALTQLARAAGARDPESLGRQLTVLTEGAVLVRHLTGDTNTARTAGEAARHLLAAHLPPRVPVHADLTPASSAA